MKMLFMLVILLGLCSCGVADQGEKGIFVRLGKVVDTAETGLNFYNPFLTSLVTYSHRIVREDMELETYTKDIQMSAINVAVSYSFDTADLEKAYVEYGTAWKEKLLTNNIMNAVKDTVGKYDAESMVGARDKLSESIMQHLSVVSKDSQLDFIQLKLLTLPLISLLKVQ